jgi:hypothetical protein
MLDGHSRPKGQKKQADAANTKKMEPLLTIEYKLSMSSYSIS